VPGLAAAAAALIHLRARACVALACIVMTLCMASIASAQPSVHTKTRVRAFESAPALNIWLHGAATPRTCPAFSPAQAKLALGSPHATKNTKDWSAWMKSEGEARALARTKLGSGAAEVGPGKLRSANGKWQYRAKSPDVADRHIHLEELDPETGEVLQNVHLRWPEGAGR
jgi:hypothetical protein